MTIRPRSAAGVGLDLLADRGAVEEEAVEVFAAEEVVGT
jgi:hypothetical protein